jgi:hypothetical protein
MSVTEESRASPWLSDTTILPPNVIDLDCDTHQPVNTLTCGGTNKRCAGAFRRDTKPIGSDTSSILFLHAIVCSEEAVVLADARLSRVHTCTLCRHSHTLQSMHSK